MNVGFIGTGRIFDLHILEYLNRADTTIKALCDKNKEKPQKKAKKFSLGNSVNYYSDYKEMVDTEDLDIVEVLLPYYLNLEVSTYAAKEGIKAISVESPMASSLEEADKMIEICENTDSMLSIYENYLFAPHIRKAKKLIDQDYIGEPSSIRIKSIIGSNGNWNYKKDAQLLREKSWHAFAIAMSLFKEKIKRVFAWSDKFKGKNMPAYIMFQFEQSEKHTVSQYGNFEFTMHPKMKIPSRYYPSDEFIEVIGTRGIMKINQGTSIGNPMNKSEVFSPLVIVRDGNVESFTEFPTDWKYSFIHATQHFLNATKGEQQPVLGIKMAREILKVQLATLQSNQKEREITLYR